MNVQDKNKKGLFIVLDGGEGAGKTTVAHKVVNQLGWNAIYTREPGGSPYAERIRELILSDEAKMSDAETQFALFWAARRDHLRHTIIPALSAGKIVITDRFDSSSYAYQIIAQGNRQLEELFWQKRKHFLQDYEPDIYIFLDITPEEGLKRAYSRGEENINHFDKRKIDFHKKVYSGLNEFIISKVNGVRIDATQPIESVVKDVMNVINEAKRTDKA